MALLSRAEIEARSGEIFPDGSFSRRYLRPAAYDLRVDLDLEADPSSERALVYKTLVLEKGQRVALRSHELIAMPWNLAANLGVKHGQAAHGLFLSSGLLVDPGFGWTDPGSGAPTPDGAHLRFLATNLGHSSLPIRLGSDGDPVLGLQFFAVAEPVDRVPTEPAPVDGARGVAFFEELIEIDEKVQAGLEEMREEVSTIRDVVDHTDKATERVVVFGIFLVSATLLGAVIAFILTVTQAR